MILFIFLFVVASILYGYKNQLDALLKIVIACSITLVIFLAEYHFGRVDFLVSDGFEYFHRPEDWIININRALWGYLNYFEKYFDLGGPFFIKVLNIPLLLIALILLADTFKRIKSPFWFVIVCPSLLSLSITNLRDILIWVMSFALIKLYFKKTFTHILGSLMCAMCLYMLRPFMLVTAVLAIMTFEIILPPSNHLLSKTSLLIRRFGFVAVFGITSLAVYPLVKSRIDSYIYNGTWLLESGYAGIAKEKGVDDMIDSSNVPKALAFASLRYVFTPQPDSIIRRLLRKDAPSSPYGFFNELLRFINQVWTYSFIIYLLMNPRHLIGVLRSLNATQRSILMWFFMFFPIYAFAHFGGSHQRLKLPFQMMLFIIAFYIHTKKSNQKKNISI